MLQELSAIKNLILFVKELVDYMRSLDPELQQHEAITLTCIYLKLTPKFFDTNPKMSNAFKQQARQLISER